MCASESVSRSVTSNSLPPMDCSPPGASVHGILQARLLEWVAIPFSRGTSEDNATKNKYGHNVQLPVYSISGNISWKTLVHVY